MLLTTNSHKRLPRRLVMPVTALALALAVPAVAHAAADTTQFSVTAGTLSFGTSPDVPNLPSLTLDGQSHTQNAQMNSYSMVDATGSGSGWNVSVNGDASAGK